MDYNSELHKKYSLLASKCEKRGKSTTNSQVSYELSIFHPIRIETNIDVLSLCVDWGIAESDFENDEMCW